MKKTLSLMLIAALLLGVLAMAGCEKKPEQAAGMPNPRTQYTSLEEINEISGMHLAGPGVMGKNSEDFYIIDNGELKIAEYDFSVAGYDYILRGAATDQDISGIYAGEGTIFGSAEAGADAIAGTEKYKAARWFAEDGQYVLVVEDRGAFEDDQFASIVEEMKMATGGGNLADEPSPAPVNPITEYESVEEINEIVGTNLVGPGVMGKTDQQYFVVNGGEFSIAEYRFTLNGTEFVFRAAPVTEDISGVYGDNGPVFEGQEDEAIVSTADCRAARWYEGNVQYVLVAKDAELDEERFVTMVDELKGLVAQQ